MSEPLVLRDVRRVYRTEAGELPVLRGAELTLHAGEIVALVAPSGAGKSTLLHLAGLLEKPDGGSVFVLGSDAGALPALIGALSHRQGNLRREAALALGEIGAPAAAPALEIAAGDPDPEVRKTARAALARLRTAGAE